MKLGAQRSDRTGGQDRRHWRRSGASTSRSSTACQRGQVQGWPKTLRWLRPRLILQRTVRAAGAEVCCARLGGQEWRIAAIISADQRLVRKRCAKVALVGVPGAALPLGKTSRSARSMPSALCWWTPRPAICRSSIGPATPCARAPGRSSGPGGVSSRAASPSAFT